MQNTLQTCNRLRLHGQRIPSGSQSSYVRPAAKPCKSVAIASAVQVTPEDKWLARTVKDVVTPSGLVSLREQSNGALKTLRMPSTRNEDYRFTDISPLLRTHIQSAPAGAVVPADLLSSCDLPGAAAMLVLVDGVLRPEMSRGLGQLPGGAYVGPLAGAPQEAVAQLGSLSASRGGPFAVLNGSLTPEVVVLAVPPGAATPGPVFVLHVASAAPAEPAGGSSQPIAAANAPRLLVHVGAGAVAELVEEYVGLPSPSPQPAGAAATAEDGRYLTVGVAELFLEADARLKHSYVQRESPGCFHFKGTLVSQQERSSYSLAEASVGAGIARHDLTVVQSGPETHTEMGHFLLCGPSQLHDLHSRLQLDHPGGTANQLHKCIVSHASGKGVFDGNVKVNRGAQKTDAGQLSRNLLLVPLATVNVKPNLQIVADDVKCTHGCAVSDLRDEELFYFRARGISAEAARQALVFSFGADVVQRMGQPALQQRVQKAVASTLRTVEAFAGTSA